MVSLKLGIVPQPTATGTCPASPSPVRRALRYLGQLNVKLEQVDNDLSDADRKAVLESLHQLAEKAQSRLGITIQIVES